MSAYRVAVGTDPDGKVYSIDGGPMLAAVWLVVGNQVFRQGEFYDYADADNREHLHGVAILLNRAMRKVEGDAAVHQVGNAANELFLCKTTDDLERFRIKWLSSKGILKRLGVHDEALEKKWAERAAIKWASK